MLNTNLKHLETAKELENAIQENENVMVCCGRMGPMCIPVYGAMEKLEEDYIDVKFYDMEFDNTEARIIRNLPECRSFRGLPFTVYYKNGKVVAATPSIQTKEQIAAILDKEFKNKEEKHA
jgi:thioredoxin 1